MRSWLFVPGDDSRKLEKAALSGADILILDLEDSVAPSRKAEARRLVAAYGKAQRGMKDAPSLYIRINALTSGLIETDLDAVMPSAPDGIVLPKAEGGVDIQHLAAKLAVREAENDLADGATKIMAIATETGKSLFALGTYAGASHRLTALTWGAEDLAADLGAETNKLPDGSYTDPYRLARSLTLFGSAAAETIAIDTVFTNLRDLDALRAEAEAARRDGFGGKMAIHPAQVPIINAVFTPTEASAAHARAVVAAFAENPGLGVIAIDGQMIDKPHLRQAERLLARLR